ncbi:YbbR domain-containing protein [Scopulibacillus darangshiensis]|uniref:YbbR domain-containing protein n=1 Tax=Scopulibacillus darangshiensis TaxID=442528 RepID=A0A4R2P2G0_9BACL|nr:CdaR family protein [Scopulibacillus darangshiensis]TCP28812.1 YbbR domain-containing protein [Scopulibacillus darangshiensis]
MDKLFKSKWFVKIISFLIALMLYTVVSSGQPPSHNQGDLTVSGDQTDTVTENLKVNIDQNKYIVSDVPDTVKIKMEGQKDLLLKAKLLKSRSAYINLENKGPGTYTVKVQTDGIPNGVKATPIPSTVTVRVQKKVTEPVHASVDLVNQGKIADGYEIGDPVIDPDTVNVTGGNDVIDSIAYVKGVLDVKNADDTIEQSVTLNAYDGDGNQLNNVQINPGSVNVTVPLTKVAKEVPVKVKTVGTPADGVKIDNVDVSPANVTIYGSPDVLSSIDKIDGLTVPVDGLKDDKTFDVNVPLPDGAEKAEPDTVSVKVSVKKDSSKKSKQDSNKKPNESSDKNNESTDDTAKDNNNSSETATKETTKQFKDIPIDVKGIDEDKQSLTFLDPKNQSIDLTLTGAEDDMKQVSATDVGASIDVQGLENGEHRVPIKLIYPDGFKGETEQAYAKIELKESSSKQTATS